MRKKQSWRASAVGVASTRPLPVQRDEVAKRQETIRTAQGILVSVSMGSDKVVEPTAKQAKHIDGVLEFLEVALETLNTRLLVLDEKIQNVSE